MSEYPVYMNAFGKIGEIFPAIKSASVPTKFTNDFLTTALGFKSSSDRAVISLLKRLGFISQSNEPTDIYRNFRDEGLSKKVMAQAIKSAYPDYYSSNEYAHRLTKPEFSNLTKRITGLSDDDKRIGAITGTFFALKDFADFEESKEKKEENLRETVETESKPKILDGLVNHRKSVDFGICYTINLNLPATTNIEVFNAIFKSLKENLLTDD